MFVTIMVNKTTGKNKTSRLTAFVLALFFLSIWVLPASAGESLDILWSKDYGGNGAESIQCVHQTADGGYIFAGYTYSYGEGQRDMFLVKTDLQGEMEWKKTYGGSGDDSANWVEQTKDGGYILAGYTKEKYEDERNIYVVKVDANGKEKWDRELGGKKFEEASCVRQTKDGSFIVSGYTDSFGAGGRDAYLANLNEDGVLVWQKTYGGTGSDGVSRVIQTKDRGYLLTGYSDSYGAGGRDVFVVKTDAHGSLVWKQTFGGTGTDSGNTLIQTSKDDYLVLGYQYTQSTGGTDIYLVRIDEQGSKIWDKTYGLNTDNNGLSVQEMSDGKFIVLGNTYAYGLSTSGTYLIKTDASGNVLQDKTFGNIGPDTTFWGEFTTYNGYIIGGMKNVGSPGGNNAFLMKLSFHDSDWEAGETKDDAVLKGTIKWPDTSEFHGQIVNNKANGYGRIEFPDGTIYEGNWDNNLFNGQGRLEYQDGNVYEGEFRFNMFHGHGTYTWPTGEEYVGDFRYNKRNGDGVFTWSNDVKYIGEFVNDEAQGYGTIIWPYGEQYTGQMSGGDANGLGIYTFPNGERYEGEFSSLAFSGLGTYYWATGARYVGQWEDDMMTGQGTYFWTNGTSQWGYWQDDRYVGLYPEE
ncbi:MAG: hypothetical protein U9N81_12385 [Bacillota bacterium]|nr:hypothetical protein [Bacillota bacterium]